MSTTILEHLIERLRAAATYNRHDLAAPSVVLWTDWEGLWSRAIPLLHDALPELLVLASEIADAHTGPSTWLRYQQTGSGLSGPDRGGGIEEVRSRRPSAWTGSGSAAARPSRSRP